MVDYKGRGWYLRKVGVNFNWGYFLYYVNCEAEHGKLVKHLGENDRLTLMTWRGMNELLHSITPAGYNSDDSAKMGITLNCKSKLVTVCPVVSFFK